MSEYPGYELEDPKLAEEIKIGSYVYLRAKVLKIIGADVGLEVELWSKTDQYRANVRYGHVAGIAETPVPDEPYTVKDGDAIAVSKGGVIWRKVSEFDGKWCDGHQARLTWEELWRQHAPLNVYEHERTV